MLTELDAVEWMNRAAETARRGVEHCDGRGIVIAGGGITYYPCVWVCVNRLREVGCTLPIELWHFEGELSEQMRSLIETLGVKCVNATDVQLIRHARRMGGWELKAYALLHSSFREVLLLDADNFPAIDPTYLFDAEEYRRCGAVFWPDDRTMGPDRLIWKLTSVEYRDEVEFESGQILVDRSRCRAPLELSMWMNENSDFWYRHFYGDKETFHLAWRKLGYDYAMTTHPTTPLPGVMCHYDFEGRRVFQHRVRRKWTLNGPNLPTDDFIGEASGMVAVARLRDVWSERWPSFYDAKRATDTERIVVRSLLDQSWTYHRIFYDRRMLTFAADGTFRDGAGTLELTWNVKEVNGIIELSFWSNQGARTCVLISDDSGDRWEGKWEIHEKMNVELLPLLKHTSEAARAPKFATSA